MDAFLKGVDSLPKVIIVQLRHLPREISKPHGRCNCLKKLALTVLSGVRESALSAHH